MSAQPLSTQVELRLQCLGLRKTDMMSKSDPFVVVYAKDPKDMNSAWKEYFRTTTIKNNLNPEWPDQIVISYQFEAMQELRFEVYDRDSTSEKLSAHDFLGALETSMSEIMGNIGSTHSGMLLLPKKTKAQGKLIVTGQEMNPCADVAIFKFRATKLERKNMMGMGKSDPFYEIHQSQGDGKYLKVFTSEVIKANLKPIWKKEVIPVQQLANGATDRELRIDVYDWESNGKHKFIGSCNTTLDELKTRFQFNLTNPRAKNKTKIRGSFEVVNFEIQERPTFLEYIQGGLEINLMVAIDFTGSNGHPKDFGSLHYMDEGFQFSGINVDPAKLNPYQLATWSVGRILQDYDHDKNIPAFGFGAYFNNDTHHCFPLNFNLENPEVHRVEGIMAAYKAALLTTQLSGPTYFNHVLRKAVGAAEEMSSSSDSQKYAVLLILTDGVINDMEKTIHLLIEGSSLPLSVIIIGVGKANFSNMEKLDADNVTLKLHNKVAKRDIVQFVPFDEFYAKGPTVLAEEVLKEIPSQVVNYFHKLKKINPNPPEKPGEHHFVVTEPPVTVVEALPVE